MDELQADIDAPERNAGLQRAIHQLLDERCRRRHETTLVHQPFDDRRQAIARGEARVQEPTTAATSSDEVRKTLLVERSAILSMLSATSSTVGARPSMRSAGRLAILDAGEVARAGAPDVAGALALLAAEIGDHGRDERRIEPGQHLGRHQALGHARAGDRRQRIDQHVVLLAFETQRIHEAYDGELGAAIVRLAEIAVDAGVRRGHHDPAIGLGAHDRPGGVRDIGGAEEVHLHHEVEIIDRHVVEGLVAQHACIVDHDVDRAEGIDRRLDDVGRALGIGHRIVVRHGLAARRLDLGHHLVGGGMIAAFAVDRAARIVHHHPGAAAGQQQRMRAAEPVAGAGDDGDAIVEADCHSPFSP